MCSCPWRPRHNYLVLLHLSHHHARYFHTRVIPCWRVVPLSYSSYVRSSEGGTLSQRCGGRHRYKVRLSHCQPPVRPDLRYTRHTLFILVVLFVLTPRVMDRPGHTPASYCYYSNIILHMECFFRVYECSEGIVYEGSKGIVYESSEGIEQRRYRAVKVYQDGSHKPPYHSRDKSHWLSQCTLLLNGMSHL